MSTTDRYQQLLHECISRRLSLASLAQNRGARCRQDGMIMSTSDPEVCMRHDILDNCQHILRACMQGAPPPKDPGEAIEQQDALAPWWDKLPSIPLGVEDLVDLHSRIRMEMPDMTDEIIGAMASISPKRLFAIQTGRARIPQRYWVALRNIKGLSHCLRAHITALHCLAAQSDERIQPLW